MRITNRQNQRINLNGSCKRNSRTVGDTNRKKLSLFFEQTLVQKKERENGKGKQTDTSRVLAASLRVKMMLSMSHSLLFYDESLVRWFISRGRMYSGSFWHPWRVLVCVVVVVVV